MCYTAWPSHNTAELFWPTVQSHCSFETPVGFVYVIIPHRFLYVITPDRFGYVSGGGPFLFISFQVLRAFQGRSRSVGTHVLGSHRLCRVLSEAMSACEPILIFVSR